MVIFLQSLQMLVVISHPIVSFLYISSFGCITVSALNYFYLLGQSISVVHGMIRVNLLSHSPPFFSDLIFLRICDLIPSPFPFSQVLEHVDSSVQVAHVQLTVNKFANSLDKFSQNLVLASITPSKVYGQILSIYVPLTFRNTFSYCLPRPRLQSKLVIFQGPLSSSVTFVILTLHLLGVD